LAKFSKLSGTIYLIKQRRCRSCIRDVGKSDWHVVSQLINTGHFRGEVYHRDKNTHAH
jgi:hypothetical protein